jgi:hypothetical protein
MLSLSDDKDYLIVYLSLVLLLLLLLVYRLFLEFDFDNFDSLDLLLFLLFPPRDLLLLVDFFSYTFY